MSHISPSETHLDEAYRLADELGQCLKAAGFKITTAESCTGGLIAGSLTEVPGSSDWFDQGMVTYSNRVKEALLGVPSDTLEQHGAVSEECVKAMASGAALSAQSEVSVAVSGIAGPGGATQGKPVGTVWLAWSVNSTVTAEHFLFLGNRRDIRQQAVICALRGTIARLEN